MSKIDLHPNRFSATILSLRKGERDVPKDEQRQRLIRRLIQVHQDAADLDIKPALLGLQIALVATERAAADRTPNPSA